MNRLTTRSTRTAHSVSRKSKAILSFQTARVFTTITRIPNIPRRNAACSGKLSRRTRPANASWPSARGVETQNFRRGARFAFTKTTPTLSGTATAVSSIVTTRSSSGIEAESAASQPGVYQVSQRADFFSVIVSIDTMNRRPLINTRDEPHVDASRYRRFHVILGDSNMSEWATAMKIGTTALVLDLIERGEAPQLEIAQPINANKSISRDETYDWIIELTDGRKISAIDVQRIYLRAAAKMEISEDRQWILREWENVLNDLQRDVMATRDRVDWTAKKFLLNALQEEEQLSWGDPWLQSIDLEYHNVDRERGLYYELVRQSSMRRVVTEDEIKMSIFTPPETTRAFFRGRSVARFNDEISSIQWDEIVFANGSQSRRVALPEAVVDARLDALNHAARNGKDFAEFMKALSAID